MKKLFPVIILFIILSNCVNAQKEFKVQSPDGKLSAKICIGESIHYQIFHNEDIVIDKSEIALSLTDGRTLGKMPKLIKSKRSNVNTFFDAAIYKKSKVKEHYNELTMYFKGDYALIFRAYDDGVAYRFVTNMNKPFEVKNEIAQFRFPGSPNMIVAYVDDRGGSKNTFEKQFFNSFENTYLQFPIHEWNPKRLAFSPLVAKLSNGKIVALVESDLLNYPGMYLNNNNGSNLIQGVFVPYPSEVKKGGHNMLQEIVQKTEPFIAKCEGKTNFPWRGIIVALKDADLANSDFVYKLASPTKIADTSWIKPGKVAWDWWNDWNLYNVNFKAGINNQTYQYYIDFASEYGIEYVILDEGWAVNLKADMLQVIPEIDLEMLAKYAAQRNVGLILWAGYNAFNADIEKVCAHYSKMGIKGFKVDFMDRDDQLMVDFHRRAAEIAAKYKMLLDFHGTYKPTGLQRTYPNVINFEGVHGLEQMKWATAATDQVAYDVTIPFIRQLAGPMDYTQGAMRNATKANYRPVYSEPMSQGTRCRQLAQYVIFESPLNMLCDNPSNYKSEPECTQFITKIPVVWDETVVLNGKIAEYITIARRKGDEWYVGAMTNWDARKLEIDLSFLGNGKYSAEVYRDGMNANRVARDYKREIVDIPDNRKLTINMAQGGGFAMKIKLAD